MKEEEEKKRCEAARGWKKSCPSPREGHPMEG